MIKLVGTLSRAIHGLQLAEDVLRALREVETISIDFADVHRMTPSFANAFIMTLLEQLSIDEAKRRVSFLDLHENVAASINQSIHRYRKGIRLSTQRNNEPVPPAFV